MFRHAEPRPDDFKVGQRVEAHPATDIWMRGDRFGTVHAIGKRWVWVVMDKSQRRLKFAAHNLNHVN